MKVTQVSICPTDAATAAGSPALTPELLAASGARYSRNNEGLESILDKIDPKHMDRSVDGIFRMLDYGHQSIADMVPVAMFMDGLSMWLAYYVWTLCPVAGGQESSTRYIDFGIDSLVDPDLLGIDDDQRNAWMARMKESLVAYDEALAIWQVIGERWPERTRIPPELLHDEDPKVRRKVERMRRNYGFDRARYYLPSAIATNVMLVMSARAWATLCQHLASHALPEAQRLGAMICEQLALCAPRLIKHATRTASVEQGLARVFAAWQAQAAAGLPMELQPGAASTDRECAAQLQVTPAPGVDTAVFASDLEHHDNRYAWIGEELKRTAVRFSWNGVTFAEIRDLNRHRTGNKYCPLVPQGFYSALDEVPEGAGEMEAALLRLNERGRQATAEAYGRLAAGDPTFVYWLPLGTQFLFEHLSTADKFIYEAELRTGTGAHYRYAGHLHDALELWYEACPGTRDCILEGAAEPE